MVFEFLFNLLWEVVWFPYNHPILTFLLYHLFRFAQRVQKNGGIPWGSPPKAVKNAKYPQISKASEQPDIVIIGASASGLAIAACLKDEGITSFVLLEREKVIGDQWENKRYHRLHLHTTKWMTYLPFVCFPDNFPIYPSRIQVVQFLRGYATMMGIGPHILFEHEVTSIDFSNENPKVTVNHKGETKTFNPKYVICCVGEYGAPRIPDWKGKEKYSKPILTSEQYKDAKQFAGKTVLVVGFRNTGHEICVDLWEQNAKPVVVVRSPINFIPRELLAFCACTDLLPFPRMDPKYGDIILRYLNTQLAKGLKEKGIISPHPSEGFVSSLMYSHEVGLLELGAIDLVRKGEIRVIPCGIKEFTAESVIFENGKEEQFDAIILATGYDKLGTLKRFLSPEVLKKVVNEHGVAVSGRESSQPRLYFIGYSDFAGRFREISLESFRVAADLKKKLGVTKKDD